MSHFVSNFDYKEFVEKDLPAAMSGKVFKHAIGSNAVLHGNHLPKFHADLVAALADLQSNDFARHVTLFLSSKRSRA